MKWTEAEERLTRDAAYEVLVSARSIYSVVKELCANPAMGGRSWNSIRGKVNCHRAANKKRNWVLDKKSTAGVE